MRDNGRGRAEVGPYAREFAPRRWPSVGSDVLVPFLQAIITGFLVAVALTGLGWGVFGLNWVRVFWSSLGAGVVLAWFWRLGVVTQTLWAVEESTGVDINRDGVVGRPRGAMRVEIVEGAKTSYVEVGGLETAAELRQFAILGVTGRLNERAVKRAFDWPRVFWVSVRDELIRRGLVTWNGGEGSTQGVALTDEGEEVMRAILESPSPTD